MMSNEIATAIPQWMASLRAAMFNAVKEADVQEIVENLIKRAKEGDDKALRMVFEYVLGGKGPQIAIQQNITMPAKKPKKRTLAMPGSADKLEVMRRRAAKGEGLFHKLDA